MDCLKLALSLTFFYFVTTLVIEPWSDALARRITGRKPVYFFLKVGSFFMMMLITVEILFNALGNQDLAQTFGLTKAAKRGKVVMRIPAPDSLTAGIILLQPHLYAKGDQYVLSFKFQIHKGVKDKRLDLAGGRFLIESIVGGKVIGQTELPLNDEFTITDSDLSGTYVSPQPFALKVKPEAIDLIWEMNAKNGDKISSKPYRIPAP
jgi:hypothetical protein